MGIREEVRSGVATVVNRPFRIREGDKVPASDEIGLSTAEAVNLDATYLYADMVKSSVAAHTLEAETVGKIIRAYLDATARVLRHFGGEIRSFDGDRVMAIFVGGQMNNVSVKAALGCVWAVEREVRPQLEGKFPSIKGRFYVDTGIGIHTGSALLIRGGVRNNNDLVSIGRAPNVAAKLSSLREGGKSIYVTSATYRVLAEEHRTTADGTNMWAEMPKQVIGGSLYSVYGCGYLRAP